MAETEQFWRFGIFELRARSRELLRNGGKLKLQEQPYQVLSALLERRGEVVTRDELRRRVWSGNTFVDFDNGLNVAIAKLRHTLDDNPEKPEYIETLPRVGYRFIAPVEVRLATAQKRAFANAKWWRGRGLVWGLISAAAIAGFMLMVLLAERPRSRTPAIAARPSLAILGFRNLSAKAEQDWVSTALSEMLATELGAGEYFRIVPGESVARARLDMALPDAERYSAGTLAKIRKRLGADYVLVGSYLNTGAQFRRLRLDLRLQNSSTAETITLPPAYGGEDDLPGLASLAALAVREKLAGGSVSQSEVSGARAAFPPGLNSARLYAEGLNRLRRFDPRGARDLLGQAVAVDPAYALAHAALSDAWSALGNAEVAKDEARKAWQLSAPLAQAERLSIEARYRETNSEWDQAGRIYQRLAEEFPDNASYGLRMAGARINAGKANDALETLERMQRLPLPVADRAAIGLVRSQAFEKLGDFGRAQSAASEAALVAHAHGILTLEADAHTMECRQLVQLSRLEQAVAACETARAAHAQTGNRVGLAASMAYLAAAYNNQGKTNEARSLYTHALDMDREMGNSGSDAQWALNGLAVLLLQQGDPAGSRRLYDESLGMSRLVGSRPDEVSALGNIATTWLIEGDLARARQLFEQALQRSRSIAAKATVASLLNNLGHTLYLLGDLAGASGMLDQAIQADRQCGAKLESADALSWLGRVHLAQARWEEARRDFTDSVQTAGEIGGEVFTAQYRLAGAELTLATGHPEEAEMAIRSSLEAFQRANLPGRELEARSLLAAALLDRGMVQDARQEVARAGALAHTTQQRATRIAFAMVAGRAAAASGIPADVNEGIRQLQAVAADAQRRGFLGYQFAARLALGEIESRDGQAAAQSLLEKLERDARASGFQHIARSAARALEKPKG